MACVRMIWLTALTGGWLFVQAQTATQILGQTTKTYASCSRFAWKCAVK
jgi:hypothetical protein